MFTVDSDPKWMRKSNSVVGIHAQQGNVMIGRQPSDHILWNAMNNKVVILSQQMNTRVWYRYIRTWECSYRNEECGNGVCKHGNGNWKLGNGNQVINHQHNL